jgi:hypothetical protein
MQSSPFLSFIGMTVLGKQNSSLINDPFPFYIIYHLVTLSSGQYEN